MCQPLDDNEDAPFAYDADRQVFSGSFLAQQNVWRDVRKVGSYVSRTRMGVRATVSSSVNIEYDVDFGKTLREALPACLQGTYSYEYAVAVPRADAPGVKADGYLVFVGRLVAPFITSSDTPGSPTLDDPRDVYERSMTVSFAPRRAAIVAPAREPVWTCEFSAGG